MRPFKRTFDKKLHDAQKSMLNFAQEFALAHHVRLDYTTQSVAELDVIVQRARKEFDAEGIPADQIRNHPSGQGIAECLGCYIVECAERKFGRGEWSRDDTVSNNGRLRFQIKESIIYPIEWVADKLEDPTHFSLEESYLLGVFDKLQEHPES